MAVVRVLLVAALSLSVWGRQESETHPVLKHKQEPTYSDAARNAHIQGNVLLQISVDEQGIPQDITVLSPLGFGLDENAIEAVSLWRFDPGRKAGQPVRVPATVEVSFRLQDERFDAEAEERRGQFNQIVNRLSQAKSKPTDKDLRAMEKLADHKSAAANYVFGLWQIEGDAGPKEVAGGLEHMRKSAALHYAPALYYLGHAEMQGEQMPKDEVHGLAHLRQAASVGSNAAQFRLGQMYEKGIGIEASVREAEKYYRLCAASNTRMSVPTGQVAASVSEAGSRAGCCLARTGGWARFGRGS